MDLATTLGAAPASSARVLWVPRRPCAVTGVTPAAVLQHRNERRSVGGYFSRVKQAVAELYSRPVVVYPVSGSTERKAIRRQIEVSIKTRAPNASKQAIAALQKQLDEHLEDAVIPV